ncbi:MAG: Co2+/Mg2+ efflux protein ApaG [Hyphomicrobiales bacterium]
MACYERTTRAIKVSVEPQYLEDRSRPEDNYFVWAYTITIENGGAEAVTLKMRYWKIVDALGRVQEVRGAGVVGETPTLPPGGSFRYTSGAPLSTPSGFMSGAYQMETETGEPFDVDIPAFALDRPDQLHRIH